VTSKYIPLMMTDWQSTPDKGRWMFNNELGAIPLKPLENLCQSSSLPILRITITYSGQHAK
jgi:hypothetical protein